MRAPCLLLVACACAHAKIADRAPPAPSFLEAQSEHYLLLTDLRQDAARMLAARMERIRAALWAGSWHGEEAPRERLRVIALGSSARLHEFANPGMSAFYQPADLFGEPFLILAAEDPEDASVVLKHELAHAQHGAFLPRSPRWLFEGLACYLETVREDAARGVFVIGEPAQDRLDFLRQHPEIDYERVLARSAVDVVSLGGEEGFAFQSASWLLVFHLANDRRAQLDDYLARLARREDSESAFAAAFPGLHAAALAREAGALLQALLRGEARVRVDEVAAPQASPDVQVRSVRAADVTAMRAQLFFLSPGLPRAQAHLAQARALAQRALQDDPTQPLAIAVQLALPEAQGAPVPLDRIEAAARQRPADYRAQLLLAFAVGPEKTEERSAALARAARLAPENATVLNAQAWHELTRGHAQQAVPIARKAAALAPGRAAVLDTLATALARSAQCEEAARIEEQALALATGSELRRQVQGRLAAMRAGCADVPLDSE